MPTGKIAKEAMAAIQELMRRGVSPNEIYRETGFKRGIDGNWIDMSKIKKEGEVDVPRVDMRMSDKPGWEDTTEIYVSPSESGERRMFIDKDGQPRLILPNVLVDPEYYNYRGFREVEEALWPYADDVYIRSTNSPDDVKHLVGKTHRGSKNWATGESEGGLSVARDIEYAGKHAYLVRGRKIGEGSDGEPLLDVSTVEVIAPIDGQTLREDILKRAEKYGLSRENVRALRAKPLFLKQPMTPDSVEIPPAGRLASAVPVTTTSGLLGLAASPDSAMAASTGTIESPAAPWLVDAANYMRRLELPIVGRPLEGLADWAEGAAYQDPDRLKRAAIGALDLM